MIRRTAPPDHSVDDPIASVRRVPVWGQVGLLAAVYFAAAKLSLLLAIPPGYATAVWPPSGIALAAALALGNRVWPGIWIGAALVNLTVESSWLASVLMGTGNTLEALAGATLIRRFIGVPYRFERGEDVVKFIALSALSASVAATVGTMPLVFGHTLSSPQILANWWTWWQGDVSGIVVVAPLILSWSARGAEASPPSGRLEAACFALLLLAVMYAVFGYESQTAVPHQWPFLILGFIIWAAFRFNQRGVTTTIAAVCAIVVAFTVKRRGPFALTSLDESLLLMLGFFSVVVTTGLVLSAVLRERGRAADELRRKRDELESRVRERTLELERANRALQEDIAERKRAEGRLQESEMRFRLVIDSVIDYAIFMLDPKGHIASWNAGAERIKGYRADEIIGQHFSRFYPAEDLARGKPQHGLEIASAEGRFEDEGWRLRKDGSRFWANVVITALRDHSGTLHGFGKVTRDLTERKRSEERLAYLAQTDALTRLPNRHMLHDRLVQTLAQAPRTGRSIGCMYIDLDRFKYVNDTFGHGAGDQLLRQAGERLQRCLRSTDIVGRLGGDEFAIILAGIAKSEDAGLVAQKVNVAFSAPFDLDGRETYVSASIGIAIYPRDGGDADLLLKNADTAMYRAKEQGRNNHQFYLPEMDKPSQRLQLDARLRGALERGEFLLHYQPKADLATGSISGFEALLRWQDPQQGLVSPGEFIPILEDTGLIIPVGEWVLQTVCEQIKAWQRKGIKPRPVSVNVSARQFQQKDLDAVISRIIQGAGIDPALIELELTESLLMKDAEETVRVLTSLKVSGVTLSVDDFGTGYSSLAYLKRFPLDELKIDGSFVRDATSESEDAEIIVAIINLAHNLKLRVVAEGVETEAQLRFLRSHGCDEMQGYYFARPQNLEDCTRLLAEDRRLPLPVEEPVAVPTVLIVDDNEDDLELITRALQPDGYRVLTAHSAQAAFDLLTRHKIGVVISDQSMTGMDGLRFLTSVRKLYPEAVRIAASGTSDMASATGAVNEAGVHKFLSKDWDAARLSAEIREALQRNRETPG
jgi:diguanylate cyclase (GGDEF)-like protein/PAS domain S-box-containing protein